MASGSPQLATLDDIAAIVDLWFVGLIEDINDDHLRQVFPGHEAGRAWVADSFVKCVKQSPSYIPEARLYVVKDDDGVARSVMLLWVYGESDNRVKSWRQRWASPGEGMSDDLVAGFFESMAGQHEHHMGKRPHIFIEVLITGQDARCRGNGTALMAVATKLAQEMAIEAYLDGTPKGQTLYSKLGFVKKGEEFRTAPPEPMIWTPRLN